MRKLLGSTKSKTYLIGLLTTLLLLMVLSAKAQWTKDLGEYKEVLNYCHIDIANAGDTVHIDYGDRILIGEDIMKIHLNNDEFMTFELGDFVYDSKLIRKVTDIENPDRDLQAMLVINLGLALRNKRNGVMVIFYLGDNCTESLLPQS